MTKILANALLLTICMLLGIAGFAQTSVSDAEEKAAKTEMLNGYPTSKYYHLTIQIPEDVKTSDKKTDRVNVYIHNKIVGFEQSEQRPFSSLPKLEMEQMLRAYEDEAYATLFPSDNAENSTPKQDPPAEKPAIILEDK